jgi:hypothetical protein
MLEPDILVSLIYICIFVAVFSGILGVAAAVAEWLERRRQNSRRLK